MSHSFFSRHYPCLFLCGFTLSLILSIAVPRAASFAAPATGLLLAGAFWLAYRKPLWPRLPELGFMIGIAGLAALSALWAIDPPFAVERGYKLALILIPGLFFIEAARQFDVSALSSRYIRVLAGLYVAACLAITIEILCGLPLYHLINGIPTDTYVSDVLMNRSVVVMTLFFLPLIQMIMATPVDKTRRMMIAGLCALSLSAALIFTQSQSAQMFIILAVAVLWLFPVNNKLLWIALTGLVILVALASPWIAQALYDGFDFNNTLVVEENGLDDHPILRAGSIPHRLEIWNFIAEEIFKHPLIGQGIEAVRYIHSEQWLRWANTDNMLHPHNAVLQIWVEFGVVGMTFACAFFTYIMHSLWKHPPALRRYQLAIAIGTLAVLCTGYGLWQSWLIGLLITQAGFAALAGQYAKGQKA